MKTVAIVLPSLYRPDLTRALLRVDVAGDFYDFLHVNELSVSLSAKASFPVTAAL